MKFSKTIFAIILLCPIGLAFSQSYTDYFVIDEIAQNYTQLEADYRGQENVFWTDGSSMNAIEQISKAASAIQVDNLHIHVATKPGAIVFSSIAITNHNIDELAEQLAAWSKVVNSQVLIYSEVVFTGAEGILLEQRLEEITGLDFTMQN
jgi:hypothetical protein